MPNEVYEAAVEGLGSLVSPRVAKRIIDESLRATSRTADDVSSSAMRRLLLGKIRKELEGVMPAAAVGPGLKHLAASLEHGTKRPRRPWWRRGGRDEERLTGLEDRESRGERRADRREEPDGPDRRGADDQVERRATDAVAQDSFAQDGFPQDGLPQDSADQVVVERRSAERRQADRRVQQRRAALKDSDKIGVTRSSVYLPDVPLPPPESAPQAGGANFVGAAVAERDAARGEAAGPANAVVEPPEVDRGESESKATGEPIAPLPELTEDLVDRAVRAFADIETVTQFVAVKRGAIVRSSGQGIDAERLQGLSVATAALLSNAGTLRVFSLEHRSGVLFLFPMRDGALVVLTKPKVNIGAVLSARSALEEAA